VQVQLNTGNSMDETKFSQLIGRLLFVPFPEYHFEVLFLLVLVSNTIVSTNNASL